MASSDDEGETFPDAVSDYYFSDGHEEPLPFSKLPVQWNESESSSATIGSIFLRGTVDNGLRKFYQQVKAWKYEFLTTIPEISVLCKDNHWIKLQKPRKSYQNLIRSILITVHCLCFLKRKPEASGKSLWDHLLKVFRSYDVSPSENDLIDHINFVRDAVKRDETLANSKYLAAFLENPGKKKKPDEDAGVATKPSFIVDDNDEPQDDDFIIKQTEDSDSDEEDHFDSVCAICDEGGKLTCCDGKCFRSFHPDRKSEEAQDSKCESLDKTPKELEGQQFKCENCQYNLHQCYVCGKLGSSDKSSNAEVFRCSSATCGHFYHPQCVANLLKKNDKAEQQVLKEKITKGDPFICPAHNCAVCKQTENEKVKDLQFAVCRRCPTSYHRKCLPRGIMFEDQIDDGDDDDADAEVRAWDGLLPKCRALIYCMKHEIIEELGTPARTLIFKNILQSPTEQPSGPLKKKKKVPIKETDTDSEHPFKKSVMKLQHGVENRSSSKLEGSFKKRAETGLESLKKRKVADSSTKTLRRNLSTKAKPSLNDGQPTLGSRLFDMYKGTQSNILENNDTCVDEHEQTMTGDSLPTEILPPIDDNSKQRILALMKDAASSISLDDIKKYHKGKVPSTHAHSSRVDKNIMLSRVEGHVEALHLALKKLEEGCSVEDAMAVCQPSVIDQLLRWKEKLRVYLAPFLHGMRYTSFGRHFTKVDKLEKIVDKLQWYIEDGDTVVDFCCGANDFSCLVKKRLDEMGKMRCLFKNYDITPPKNDFNFEKRDWMTVRPRELPCGSQLIMGLNPPFGVNASLANQFIDNALRFKPKLLILIVPPETERLDSEKKKVQYDLVWEDAELLAGKSFYLPGSIDVSDKQVDSWNNTPPPLYLWSHPDWTSKHKTIARLCGHIPEVREPRQSDENMPVPGPSVVTGDKENDLPMPIVNLPGIKKGPERTTGKAKKRNKKRKSKESLVQDNGNTEIKNKKTIEEEKSNQNPNKRNRLSQEKEPEKPDYKHLGDPSRQEQEAEKYDDRDPRVFSDEGQAQKHEETLKHDKSRASPLEDYAQKHDKTQAPSREDQTQKVNKNQASSREDQTQKLNKNQASSRDDQVQNYKMQGPSRENQAQRHDKTQGSSREGSQKPREIEAPKLDNRHATHEDSAQKFNNKHHRAPSRENEVQKLDNKHNSPTVREDQAHETRDTDFSFLNDERLFDQSIEMRYNDESTFSLQNDAGPSFDPFLDRRYPTTEEPYPGSGYRRLEGTNLLTSSYSTRPDPVQYTAYDRVGRGSYFDEMSSRSSNYSMAHHEPGLTRGGAADIIPYNRTSTSTMQRYAPRLDELNSRMNMGRSEVDGLSHTRMSSLGHPEPLIGNRGVVGYHPPLHGPGYRTDSIGFAPGPYNPYSQHNSSGGWLNE
uniref:protein ENHANCED DOWNY MILDEW 2-like n=1 Tax=Erigeron canadensis TaxID=72917 RepID=UPI001CB8EE42|nr:protein ENHANCED DOWNY MILDEW 2-like [Erigeron canadensis]